MAGDGNKVGEVYVEIKATGAENVAKEVQKAQAMATAPGGFTQLPAWAGNAGASSTMTGGGGAAAIKETTSAVTQHADAVGKADTATKKYTESKKSLRQEMVGLRQNIMGTVSIIGAFATAIGAGIQGLIGFKNAARDVSNELRSIDEGFKVTTTAGLSNFQTLTIAANDYYKNVQERIDLERESGTELLNAFLSNSKIRADITADGLKVQIADSDMLALKEQQNAATLKKNLELINIGEQARLDLLKEQASFKESAKYLGNFNKEAEATIEAQRKVELAQLEGAAKIRKQRDFDIEDLQKKKAASDDQDIRDLLDKQIKAREELAAVEVGAAQKTQDEIDRIKREGDARALEQAKQAANAQAQAISEAYTKATADIMANFANQQSQSIEELAQYVKLIAEGVGR